MMKIKYPDAAYIMNYRQEHKFRHYCCNWTLSPYPEGEGHTISCKIKWLVYLPLVIPVHIINLFICAWCGIKENYEFVSPKLESHHFAKYDYANDRAKEVEEKYEKK